MRHVFQIHEAGEKQRNSDGRVEAILLLEIFMSFTSRLQEIVTVGLMGLAFLGGSRSVNAAPIFSYNIYTTNGLAAGTNLLVNTPYELAVTLSTTNLAIDGVNWDFKMPGTGVSYTNFMQVTGTTLPTPTLNVTLDDFFAGYAEANNPAYNYVATSVNASGILTPNQRLTTDAGPATKQGAVEWVYFTPTTLATNKSFSLNNITLDSNGSGVSYTKIQPLFNVVSIPETSTSGLALVALGIAYALRRKYFTRADAVVRDVASTVQTRLGGEGRKPQN